MNGNTLVMKFGGTSVGSAEAMAQAVEIVRQARQEWPRVVVVTSALSGVTNLLLDSASQAAAGNAQRFIGGAAELKALHTGIAEKLIAEAAPQAQMRSEINLLVSEFTNLCHAINVLGEATPRALDAVASLGERMSIRLLAAALESQGVASRPIESTLFVITDNRFQAAHPNIEETNLRTRQLLNPLLDQGIVPVSSGFIGATREGITTTLGRGGSDYSAALIGAALPADDVWIWTDVDGVMTADPRMVPGAHTISQLSYREVAELAYFGAKVLHPKSIRPVVEAGIGLRVCNTFNPKHPGTRIYTEVNHLEAGKIKAVTTIRKQVLVTIEGRGMLGVPGVAARAFAAVAATHTSVPLITQASSEQSICFAVPSESAKQVLDSLRSTFALELASQDIDSIGAGEEVEIITTVGAGMRATPGVAGRIFSILGENKVNVIAIAQGSSEVSISLVVDARDAKAAVAALHQLITDDLPA
jgi:aspartate kinase